ncbi:hypothetical protein RJ639_039826 [Escallonia herrerae]|uniref:R13L1/DRL21-like LRR repeat region domain-containing protein n=1 Tax=Escallonia herrerae TaxID=1293975 RepID=A0AA88WLV9_9ASTE|nr:hypothetical protein RJ639_039826 [Escallonia herrerae]
MAQPTQASKSCTLRKLIPACCSTNFTPRVVKFHFNISSKIENITERLQDLQRKKSELNLMIEHVGDTRSRRTGDERSPSTSLVDEYSGFYAESIVPHRNSLFKARHSTFIRHKYDGSQKFEAFSRAPKLRTFLPLPVFETRSWQNFYLTNHVIYDLLPQLHVLRVLSLSGYNISQLPNAIGNLKHLRYLNVSGTTIEQLPESVSELFNLQTLLLRDCRRLTKLPKNTGNLVNLRHLDIAGTTELQEMPLGLCKMTSLQTLSKIVLGRGMGVNELRGLSNLKGALSIIGLHIVMDTEDAREANLTCKQRLEELELVWCSDFDDSRNKLLEKEVIDLLKPSTNLKRLGVKHYGGLEFPSWLGDPSFSHLEHVLLNGCRDCTSLPSLGHLPSLKVLHISGIEGVKSVGNELYGVGCPQVRDAFPSLETLKFVDMVSWEEWYTNFNNDDGKLGKVFPRLRKLIIAGCPNLINISLPRLPSILVLKISQCQEVLLTSMVSIACATSTLEIREISGLVQLHEGITQFLGARLEVLVIQQCNELVSLWQGDAACHNLVNTRNVAVSECSGLVSLVGEEGQELPPNLEKLEIWSCVNLEKLPKRLKSLKSLRLLSISHCPRVIILSTTIEEDAQSNINDGKAEDFMIESFSQLEALTIYGHPSLVAFPLGQRIPTTLKRLYFEPSENMEPDSEEMWLPKSAAPSPLLESIIISSWANLKFLPGSLFKFVHLTSLYISSCSGLESFPEREGFPPSLQRLYIGDCVNLKYLIPDDDRHQMQGLASLLELTIYNCPSLEWFPRRCWPPNLTTLVIEGDIKRPSSGAKQRGWDPQRLPASLADLEIIGGASGVVELFYNCLELKKNHSLASLRISKFKNVESIPTGLLRRLTFLESLEIWDCPKFRSLPRGLLPTLSCLQIGGCPVLQQRCSKEKGDYWPLIANIPCVEIDDPDSDELTAA